MIIGTTLGANALSGISTASNNDITVVTQAGTLEVGQAVTADGTGDVTLIATGGVSDIAIRADIQTGEGDIELTAGNSITTDNNGDVIATVNDRGTLALRAVDAIGETGASIDTDVAIAAAQITGGATTGDIFLNQIDGVQDDLTIGTTQGVNALSGISTANNNDIHVVTQAGTLTVDQSVTADGIGDVTLTATGTTSDLAINDNIQTGSGDIELTAGRSITTDTTGDVIATVDGSGSLALRAVDAIGDINFRIDTDVAVVAVEVTGGATTGDIFLNQINGVQGDLTIGTTLGAIPLSGIETANNNDITVVTQAGNLTLDQAVTADGTGDVRMTATTGALSVDAAITTVGGTVALSTDTTFETTAAGTLSAEGVVISSSGSVDLNAPVTAPGGFSSSGTNFDNTGAPISATNTFIGLSHSGTVRLGATMNAGSGGQVLLLGGGTFVGTATVSANSVEFQGNIVGLDSSTGPTIDANNLIVKMDGQVGSQSGLLTASSKLVSAGVPPANVEAPGLVLIRNIGSFTPTEQTQLEGLTALSTLAVRLEELEEILSASSQARFFQEEPIDINILFKEVDEMTDDIGPEPGLDEFQPGTSGLPLSSDYSRIEKFNTRPQQRYRRLPWMPTLLAPVPADKKLIGDKQDPSLNLGMSHTDGRMETSIAALSR